MIKETLLKFFKLDELMAHLTEYIETRLELVKYDLKEDLARAISKGTIVLTIAGLITLVLFFASISLAFLLSEWVGLHTGFAIVAGLYLVLMIVVIIFRGPISHKVEQEIKKTLHKHHENTGDGRPD
jgi:cytochrome b subunit of formate dehydrogenase